MLTVAPSLPGLTPSVEEDDDEVIFIDQNDTDDMIGLFAGIEYQCANGKTTRRRITINNISYGLIIAYCHEREAVRTFRLDRIRAFFDLDGVVYSPDHFLHKVVRLDSAQQNRLGKALRSNFSNEIKVLASLSGCDGFMHDAEVEEIVKFVGMQAENEGIAYSDDDLDALARSVRRAKVIWIDAADAMLVIASSRQYESRTLSLVKAAGKVANADGFVKAKELAFLHCINEILGNP